MKRSLPRILRDLCRFFLATVLTVALVHKLTDPTGFVSAVDSYRVLPSSWVLPAALLLMSVEAVLLGWLISGRRLAWAATACMVLFFLSGGWAALGLLRHVSVADAGLLDKPLSPDVVAEAGVLVLVAAVLHLAARIVDLMPRAPRSHGAR